MFLINLFKKLTSFATKKSKVPTPPIVTSPTVSPVLTDTTNHWDTLPNELKGEIFSWLPLASFVRAAEINKNSRAIINNNLLWKNKFKHYFPHKFKEVPPQTNINWKDRFQQNWNALIKNNKFSHELYEYIATNNHSNLIAYLNNNKNDFSTLIELDSSSSHSFKNPFWQLLRHADQKTLDVIFQCIMKRYQQPNSDPHSDTRGYSPFFWAIICKQPPNILKWLRDVKSPLNKRFALKDYYKNWRITLSVNIFEPIHLACMFGNADAIQFILDNNINTINTFDDDGIPPLYWAIRFAHKEIVDILVAKGAKFEFSDTFEYRKNASYIYYACKHGYFDLVKQLIADHPNWINKTHNSKTLLMVAAQYGHLDLVNYLIEKGARISDRSYSFEKNYKYEKLTALDIAIMHNQTHIAIVLLEKYNLLEPGSFHIACTVGNSEIAKRLLQKNSLLLNYCNINNESPLLLSIKNKHYELAEYLILSGANITLSDFNHLTPLDHLATQPSNESNNHLAKMILKLMPEWDKLPNNFNFQSLDLACKSGNLELVKMIVKKYPNLINHWEKKTALINHWINDLSNTPPDDTILKIAIENGHQKIAAFLINEGQSLDVKFGPFNTSMLLLACQKNQLNVVKLILEKNPSLLEVADKNNYTPLMIAAQKGHVDIIKHLIQCGAALDNVTTDLGYNALHLAALEGRSHVIPLIIERHPGLIDSLTSDSKTALDIAGANKKIECVNELMKIKKINLPLKDKSKLNEKLMTFFTYERETKLRADDDYRNRWKAGYSAGQKKEAVAAYRQVMFGYADASSLKKHKGALTQGRLGKIIKEMGMKI